MRFCLPVPTLIATLKLRCRLSLSDSAVMSPTAFTVVDKEIIRNTTKDCGADDDDEENVHAVPSKEAESPRSRSRTRLTAKMYPESKYLIFFQKKYVSPAVQLNNM